MMMDCLSTMENNKWVTTLIAILLCIVFLLLLLLPSNVVSVAKADEDHKVEFVAPQLKAICACESVGRWDKEPKHWDEKGSVLRGRMTPEDIGQCQINEYYHGETAKKMGIDIHSFNGNIQFANYLYIKNGTRDWEASRSCWDK